VARFRIGTEGLNEKYAKIVVSVSRRTILAQPGPPGVCRGLITQIIRNVAISVANTNVTGCGDSEPGRPTELAAPHQIAPGVHIKKMINDYLDLQT
jgi:hypothetical protein